MGNTVRDNLDPDLFPQAVSGINRPTPPILECRAVQPTRSKGKSLPWLFLGLPIHKTLLSPTIGLDTHQLLKEAHSDFCRQLGNGTMTKEG